MSWTLTIVLLVGYCGAVAAFIAHLGHVARTRHAKPLPQDDAGIAILEQRLHRELKRAG